MPGDDKPDLVTGATGFVGSHLVRALVARGRPVRALVRPGTDAAELGRLGVEVVPGDVTDRDAYEAAAHRALRVFHVAGFVSFLAEERKRLESVNVEGVRNAVRAARSAKASVLVVTSSVAAVGGSPTGGEVDEATPWTPDPRLGYATTKHEGEAVALAAHGKGGLRVVCVNPSIVLGPEDPRPSAGGDYVIRAAEGRIPVCASMLQSFVDVRDAAEGHLLAAERSPGGKRYILSGGSMRMREFVAAVREAAGNPGRPLPIPTLLLPPLALAAEWWAGKRGTAPALTLEQARMAGRKGAFNAALARRELGWSPRPLAETIRETVAWFRGAGMMG
ncbi:MAG: NAD-dependent epimerase/dehydratase family protein [Planctomycetes bacterium]|nr:NAD-dependent epimerase/dehydratase family protein [Planctomycetota bacterium]